MASDDEPVLVSDGSESDEEDEEVMEMPVMTTEEQSEIERIISALPDAAPQVSADTADGAEADSEVKISKEAEKQSAKMAGQDKQRSRSIVMRLKILREVRNAGKDGKNIVLFP